MSNILLVEPEYRSKFPPLGLLRLSTHHKRRGDHVAFVRGKNQDMRRVHWDRVYVASLFTWELPRTLETLRFYTPCVSDPAQVIVGGVGATLLPRFLRERALCTVIEGPLDKPGILGPRTPTLSDEVPDYSILDSVDYDYRPADAYFARITKGCIRKCSFCAVPLLEREFGFVSPLADQILRAKRTHGEKQHLVILDNNVLAIRGIYKTLDDIAALGFAAGARRNNQKRSVDFNQGIDARLIAAKPDLAKALARLCLDPVRLAFDFIGMHKQYEKAIRLMADVGFVEFTNYMLFNFNDSPEDLFERMWVNAALNAELGIRITGFPMRFIPMDDVNRRHVAPKWKWRYLRGIQCVLLATQGLVSPNSEFLARAFGESMDEFLEILAMPDRYIVYRQHYAKDGAKSWKKMYRKLDSIEKDNLLMLLDAINSARGEERQRIIAKQKGKIRGILEHYYPKGRVARMAPL